MSSVREYTVHIVLDMAVRPDIICGAGAIPLRLWIRTVTAAIPTRFFQNGTDASIGALVTNPVWSSARKLAVRV